MKRLLITAALLSLTACSTIPTVYGPSPGTSPRSIGFTDYRIEAGRYRVTFTGGGGAPLSQVADYALLRAAEVALRDGYDWFRVVDRVDQQMGSGSSGPQVLVGGGVSGFDDSRRRGGSVSSGAGIGLGTSFDLSGGPAFQRTIEVLAGKGPRPEGGDAYDAREIVRRIGGGNPG